MEVRQTRTHVENPVKVLLLSSDCILIVLCVYESRAVTLLTLINQTRGFFLETTFRLPCLTTFFWILATVLQLR